MSEKTITIKIKDGVYRIQNSELSHFELLGLLECVAFDLKTAGRGEKAIAGETAAADPKPETTEERSEKASKTEAEPPAGETAREQNPEQGAPDVKTRIGNAVKAIRSLGGEVSEFDLDAATDEELQAELEELKNQYKRLKSSQKPKK